MFHAVHTLLFALVVLQFRHAASCRPSLHALSAHAQSTRSVQVHGAKRTAAGQIGVVKCQVYIAACLVEMPSCVQVAENAFKESPPARPVPRSGADKAERTKLVLLSQESNTDPSTWTAEQAWLNMGATPGPEPYVANQHGGVLQPRPLYEQDFKSSRAKCAGEKRCQQRHESKKKLGPGLFVRTLTYLCPVLASLRCHRV